MAKKDKDSTQLSKRAKVVARVDLRDVPEGTPGRVTLVNGFAWIRYWVRFDNGISLGSLDRDVLATADEWKRHLAGEDVWGEAAAANVGSDDAADGGDSGESSGPGKATPSGTIVPQRLLDMSARARARLAA